MRCSGPGLAMLAPAADRWRWYDFGCQEW